jgi:hypothetical protein
VRLGTAVVALVLACAGPARAGDVEPRPAGPTEPRVRPNLFWALTQLVPSPEVVAIGVPTHAELGLRWQVTPLFFATGLRPGFSPWRWLVVEPRLRGGGGVELYASPELVTAGASLSDDFYFRPGVRSYFPLIEHGETMSCSLGAAAVIHGDRVGAALEGGVYAFAGIWGLQVAYVPTRALRMTTITFAARYF